MSQQQQFEASITVVRGVYHNRVCLIEGALLELAQRAPNFIQPLPVVSLAVDVPDRLYEELTVEDVDAVLVGFVSRLVSSHERQRLTSAGTGPSVKDAVN